MSNINRQIGTNIAALMQDHGISNEEMAEHLGYSLRDIGRIIDGRVLISPSETRQIAGFLHVDKNALLKSNEAFYRSQIQSVEGSINIEGLDRILDLLDDYIELKESLEN